MRSFLPLTEVVEARSSGVQPRLKASDRKLVNPFISLKLHVGSISDYFRVA